jgi:hypothetical protein
MRYWFDTEFIEDGKTIDLISIGIVAEDGRELYLCNKGCDFNKASDWVWENVLTPIGVTKGPGNGAMYPIDPNVWVPDFVICSEVLKFCGGQLSEAGRFELKPGASKPEFWAYYADYDWIAFCQLFGTMMELPQGFSMYCRDLKQTIDELGCPDIPKQTEGEHNALNDAKWAKDTWLWLKDRYRHPGFGNYPVEQLRIQVEALA